MAFGERSVGSIAIDTSKLSEAFEKLGGISAKTAEIASKISTALIKAFDEAPVLKYIGKIAKLAKAFETLGEVIKIAFSPLTTALSFVGKIFSGISNILMLPFGALGKIGEALKGAWDFLTKPAEGSNSRAYEAAKLRMSASQLKELEYAEKASGTNGEYKNFLSRISENLTSADSQGAFISLGLDPQALLKQNAATAGRAVFDAIKARWGDRDFDSMSSKAEYEAMGLDKLMSFDDARTMQQGFFDDTEKTLNEFMKTTKYSDKALRMLEKAGVNVSRAFDNLKLNLAVKFGPAAVSIANTLMEVLASLVKDFEPALKALGDKAKHFFSKEGGGTEKLKEWIFIIIDALKLFARVALDTAAAISKWVPGVETIDTSSGAWKAIRDSLKTRDEIATEKSQSEIDALRNELSLSGWTTHNIKRGGRLYAGKNVNEFSRALIEQEKKEAGRQVTFEFKVDSSRNKLVAIGYNNGVKFTEKDIATIEASQDSRLNK